jgi:Tfp pilus assembly protein PilE
MVFNHQDGVGLIEVLVSSVVVAVGLLAVAFLQSGLVAGSRENKVRAEALSLTAQKLEELRHNINQQAYLNLIDGQYSDTIAGTQAYFFRNWHISDITPFSTDAPKRKRLSVEVSWDGDNGVDSDGDGFALDANEKVSLVSELAWVDPAKSAVLSGINGAGIAGQVRRVEQNAVEQLAIESRGSLTARILDTSLPNGLLLVELAQPNSTRSLTLSLRQIAPNSHYFATAEVNPYSAGAGVISVFLCATNACKFVENILGGVALRITGQVFSQRDNIDKIQVEWASSGNTNTCFTSAVSLVPSNNRVEMYSMAYECVLAGNCNATADGANGCFQDSLVSDTQINGRQVGVGGEFGSVGLLGLDDQARGPEQVCFLENMIDSGSVLFDPNAVNGLSQSYLSPTSKRFYGAKKISHHAGMNVISLEGINRSYSNHNFLIVSAGLQDAGLCRQSAQQLGIVLAPREIIRTLNENDANRVLAEQDYSSIADTIQEISGNVLSDSANLQLYVPELGSCFLNNNHAPEQPATKYNCVLASNDPNLAVAAASLNLPNNTPATFGRCLEPAAQGVCNWPSDF